MQEKIQKIPLYIRQARRKQSLTTILTAFFIVVQIIWVGLPIFMAVLWSLVDPDHPWSFPSILPEKLSLAQWVYVFKYTNIVRALKTSYMLAPCAVALSFLLGLPTAYVLGRKQIRGKKFFETIVLLPMIMPGMVVALFLSRVFTAFGLAQNFFGLVLAHTLMALPYMIRLLATSFEAIPQDIIDAAENLGANTFVKIKDIFLPMIRPGLLAGIIFAFTTSIEEFNLTFVIGTPTFETIPTILYSFLGYNFIRTNASVVALIMMIPNIILLFIVEDLLKFDYLSASLGKL
ncbi:MAG TPA: ABC transporter permease [Rectinema sp.]|jgi:putative spermidine/putrescine transport system permease protein|nr:MAG: Inner membrane ABC transporter permease protein YdcV [Spirochaetes bacterium ADurb.Bin110]HNV35831.1 ABC transporter permease [Rectinema sp.]HOO02238.1 ABC transporter permease [Rectinema sp.]